MDYENVLLVKNEVFVYRIPPRQSNRGFRAADWTLDTPHWTGRLRVVAKGRDLTLKLEDRNTGELFAKCPVDAFPGIAVEPVLDSSRYFVIRLMADDGRTMFTGLGFSERSDSFDLNVAIQDHFKGLKQEREVEEAEQKMSETPNLDLGFKEGQKIKLNLNTRRTGDDPTPSSGTNRPRPSVKLSGNAGSVGLLPPPPAPAVSRTRGQRSIVDPSVANAGGQTVNLSSLSGEFAQKGTQPAAAQPAPSGASDLDLLADIFGSSAPSAPTTSSVTNPVAGAPLSWADFK